MGTTYATEPGRSSVAIGIWGRIVRPDRPTYTPEAARAILELDFDPADHRRIVELSAKANEGALTPPEREELEDYVEINDILALLQSKARLSLKQAGQSLRGA